MSTPSPTSERIRVTAAELFATRGFAATSVRDIAAAAGVTPGAIYNHFESKEAILNAIAVDGHQALVDILDRVSRYKHATAVDRLDALVDALTLFCLEHPISTQVFEHDYAQLTGSNQERILELRTATLTIFEKAIRSGVRHGEFSVPPGPPGNTRLLARTIVNALVLMTVSFGDFPAYEPAEVMSFYRELARRMAAATAAPRNPSPRLSKAR